MDSQEPVTDDHRRKSRRIIEIHTVAVRIVPSGISPDNGKDDKVRMEFRSAYDISLGGMCLLSAELIAPDTRLRLFIALKAPARTITHTGTVRWVRRAAPEEPYAVGVEFTTSSPAELQAWADYIGNKRPG